MGQRQQDGGAIHSFSGREVAEKVVAPPKLEFLAKLCPKCSEKNAPGMKYCGRCGCPPDSGELAKSSVEVEELRRKLDEVLKKLEARK